MATFLKSSPRGNAISLSVIAFSMGASGLAYEYTFSKLSSDLLGFSAKQWGLVIALMLLFMGVGSDLQKHLRDKNLFQKFVGMELFLSVLGGFASVVLWYLFGVNRDLFVLFLYSVIAVVGLFIGMEIPILIRLNQAHQTRLEHNLGQVLRMDYIGAFVGAMGWLYLLTTFRNILQIGIVFGIANLLATLWVLVYYRSLSRRVSVWVCATLSLIALMGASLVVVPTWTAHLEQRLFRDEVVLSRTTDYQHIVLTRSPSEVVRCYINGNLQFSSSDEFIYHELLVHPAMHIAKPVRDVLVLGGGDGLAVRELLKYSDVTNITLVDLDPGMTELARGNEHFLSLNEGSLLDAKVMVLNNDAVRPANQVDVSLPDRRWFSRGNQPQKVARVFLVHVDAVKYASQVDGFFDVVVLDFPDPSQLELSKLYSLGFYQNLRRKLRPNGVLVQQSTSPSYTKEAFLCIGKTLERAGFSVLPYREVVPSFGDWGFWIARSRDSFPAGELRQQWNAITGLEVDTKHLTTGVLGRSLVFGKGFFDGMEDPKIPHNTVLNNVIFYLYQGAVSRY